MAALIEDRAVRTMALVCLLAFLALGVTVGYRIDAPTPPAPAVVQTWTPGHYTVTGRVML